MTTSRFTFRDPEGRELDPTAWLSWWADRYRIGDNPVYFDLIARHEAFSAEDFEQIGKWKEGCLKPGNGRWKTGTPTAYDVWMGAKAELPKCPEPSGVTAFLTNWSERMFSAGKGHRKRFGLSRATTLLHFVSGGQYPILDSRVVTALIRLGSPIAENGTISGYLNSFCRLFAELSGDCGVSGVKGLRKLDNALFSYGKTRRGPAIEARDGQEMPATITSGKAPNVPLPLATQARPRRTSEPSEGNMDAKYRIAFEGVKVGTIYKLDEIWTKMKARFPDRITAGRILPQDRCYNITNAGLGPNRNFRIFEYIGRATFCYLGEDYPYNGVVTWKGVQCGQWENGVLTKLDNWPQLNRRA